MIRTSSLAAALLLVAGCQSGPSPKAVDTPAEPAVIQGQAYYLERMALPPGAMLEVRLIAEPKDAMPSTVALQQFSGLSGPPFTFALPYDPARIQAGMHYALRASLRDANGHLVFYTGSRVEVTPGQQGVVELRLMRSSVG